jgi:NADP-dependent 3-hydroxy acid dehydrogenase YdfG
MWPAHHISLSPTDGAPAVADDTFDRLAGLAGIVTGAGRGIGEACATTLAGHGARVLLADLDGDVLEEVATRIRAAGGEVALHTVDVREWPSVEELCRSCVDTFGSLDFAVANAGIGDYSSLDTGDPERWRSVVETNLLGVLHTVRGAFPRMKAQRRGDIVLMASIAGRQSWVGEPVYIATKWGVVGLGWALRKEALEHNVRVTMIEPSMVDTPLVRATEEGRDELERFATLQAEDVARAVAFAIAQPEGVAVSELVIQAVGPEL